MGKSLLTDRPGLRLVLYHGILPDHLPYINGRFLHLRRFREHLAYYQKHFQVITLDQAFSGDYDPKRFALVITFDDGYCNNMTLALPELERYQLPATFFITATHGTGIPYLWADLLDVMAADGKQELRIGDEVFKSQGKGSLVSEKGSDLKQLARQRGADFMLEMRDALLDSGIHLQKKWAPYLEMLSVEEIRGMAQSELTTIGGHGTQHVNLNDWENDKAIDDAVGGVRWLRELTGKPVRCFAFPDGAGSEMVSKALVEAGVDQLLLTEKALGKVEGAEMLERMTVHPWISTKNQMAELLRGRYI